MESTGILEKARIERGTDEEVVDRVRAGETALYEIVMRRYNQRLYRIARAIVRDDAEAEDVMQAAYVSAFEHLAQFAGRAPFSTWLTRIAVHEALLRLHKRGRLDQLEDSEDGGKPGVNMVATSADPEQMTTRAELRHFLEEAILDLPQQYRAVLMLRDIEELSTAETADALGLTEENVKVRLHRGHGMVRSWLLARVGANARDAFPFMGVRCDRIVRIVLASLSSSSLGSKIQ